MTSKHFGPGPDGIPGNDDGGAMSSNLIFSLLGIFPLAGSQFYFVGVPHFEYSSMRLPEDKGRFHIIAHKFTAENKYVQRVALNGRLIKRAWLRHDEISNESVLEFWMGREPVGFDTIPLPKL